MNMMSEERLTYALSLSGKYSKKVLTQMEMYLQVKQLDPVVRKYILDGFEELRREMERELRAK